MKNYLHRITVLASLALFLMSSPSWAADEFPGRAKYPGVPVLSKHELKAKFNDYVIVDTRSKLEFETLRINGATNIPVASKTFADQIKTLRTKTHKTIVFYCNGRTCMKSYRAVKQANKARVKNTIAYDAGMFEWAKAYPEMASLLGKSPIQPNEIISKKAFKARSLEPNAFMDKVHQLGSKSLVLDIRDKYQRGAAGFFPGKERWASLDDRKKLDEYIAQAKRENRPLFIYDEVGKQVRWLQYALEKNNVKNYYFMETGAKGYYKQMMKDFGIR